MASVPAIWLVGALHASIHPKSIHALFVARRAPWDKNGRRARRACSTRPHGPHSLVGHARRAPRHRKGRARRARRIVRGVTVVRDPKRTSAERTSTTRACSPLRWCAATLDCRTHRARNLDLAHADTLRRARRPSADTRLRAPGRHTGAHDTARSSQGAHPPHPSASPPSLPPPPPRAMWTHYSALLTVAAVERSIASQTSVATHRPNQRRGPPHDPDQ